MPGGVLHGNVGMYLTIPEWFRRNLKPVDIDRQRGILLIRQSKGKKDRITPISGRIINLLDDYSIATFLCNTSA